MKTYQQLKDEFDREVAELQDVCIHENTKWLPYQWAPGHFSGTVEICLICDKIINRKNDVGELKTHNEFLNKVRYVI